MTHHPALSRRRLLGGGVAALALATLSACGSDATSPAAGGAASGGPGTPDAPEGPWRWTDDLGQEVELEQAPVRIAAYGDAAAALMGFGITPVAIFHYIPPSQDATFEDLDLSGVEVVGEAYGEINLERLAAARPDLVVTTSYDGEEPSLMYGFKDEGQMEKVRALAPVVGVLQAGSALDVIRTNERLAAALGVDVTAGTVAQQRRDFEAASQELTEAARSGVTMVPVYAEQAGGLWFAKAQDDPALAYYRSLGVQLVDVGGDDYYWHQVSWENADTYEADVVLYSLRGSLTPEQLMDQPTFAALPAARADQLRPWKFKAMDYPSQTAYMRELASWLSTDEKVV